MSIIRDGEAVLGVVTHGHAAVLATLAAVAALGVGYLIWHDHVFNQGVAACEMKDAVEKQAYDAKVVAAQAQTAQAVAEGEKAVAQAVAVRPNAAKAAQQAAQAVPTFAVVQRPPALADQRRRELAAIGVAAGGKQ